LWVTSWERCIYAVTCVKITRISGTVIAIITAFRGVDTSEDWVTRRCRTEIRRWAVESSGDTSIVGTYTR
jgi:allantoicase